jgi:glyoxylase I family protein
MAAPTPAMDGIVHVALTVTDVDASVAWYRRVLGMEQAGIAPHEGGFGIVMSTPDEQVWLALHHHDANPGEPFTETRTGLDHVAFHVPSYEHLVAWRDHFDAHGVRRSEIVPIPDYGVAALVFYDPDAIQLELIGPPAPTEG